MTRRPLLALALLCTVSCGGSDATVTSPIASVTFTNTDLSLGLGATMKLVPYARNEDLEVVEGITGYTWASSDETIASVDADGTVHARKLGGPVAVTVTLGAKSATVNVRVTPANVIITPQVIALDIGQTVQLTAQPVDAANAAIDAGAPQWSVDGVGPEPVVATVSQSGLLTAVSAGLVTVNVTISGKTSQLSTGVRSIYDAAWSGTDNTGRVTQMDIRFGVVTGYRIPLIQSAIPDCAIKSLATVPNFSFVQNGEVSFTFPPSNGISLLPGGVVRGTISGNTMTGTYPAIGLGAWSCSNGTAPIGGMGPGTFTLVRG